MTTVPVTTVNASLDAFLERSLAFRQGQPFQLPFDDQWTSRAETGEIDEQGNSYWLPTRQVPPISFAGLENALEEQIHPDIVAYFSRFWSGSLEAQWQEGHLSLIQLWNEEDFDRLVENLIGHALAKRRVKQPFTVFFATVEPDSEYFLSVDNATGKVLMEEAGKLNNRVVAPDLASFLLTLSPSLAVPGNF